MLTLILVVRLFYDFDKNDTTRVLQFNSSWFYPTQTNERLAVSFLRWKNIILKYRTIEL